MANNVDLVMRLLAEDRASAQFQKVGKEVERTGSKFSRFAAVAGGALAGVGFVALAKDSIRAASDLNETMSKSQVVFGKSAAMIDKWGNTAATAMGMSKQQATEAAATFGNLFVSMRLGEKTSANMSTKLVQLAGDLASFNNVSPEDALLALRSGLVGEVEPLRKFGVNLSAVAINAEALSSGLVKAHVDMGKLHAAQLRLTIAQEKANKVAKDSKSTDLQRKQAAMAVATAEGVLAKVMEGKVPQLTAAQKAQAAYKLILDQTKTAQGDFGRTSDGLANSQRILQAEFEDSKAKLGSGLLPIMTTVVHTANDMLSKFNGLPEPVRNGALAVAGLAAAFTMLAPRLVAVKTLLSSSSGGVGGAAKGLSRFKGAMSGALGLLGGPWGLALGAGAMALGYFAAQSEETKQQTDALTDALKQSSGAFDQNARAQIVNTLEQKGMLQVAQRLGIAEKDLVDALLGDQAAKKRVDAATRAATTSLDKFKDSNGKLGGEAQNAAARVNFLTNGLKDMGVMVGDAEAAEQRFNDAMNGSATSIRNARKELDKMNASLRRLDGHAGISISVDSRGDMNGHGTGGNQGAPRKKVTSTAGSSASAPHGAGVAVVQVHLDGRAIQQSIVQVKRQQGGVYAQ